MKLLITSDAHLNEEEPERLTTFFRLVELGIREGIDAFLVGGDLFHSNRAFRSLKGEFSTELEKLEPGFKIFTVPGNHDSEISSSNFLGENFSVLDENDRRRRVSSRDSDLEVVGLPFREGAGRAEIADSLPAPAKNRKSLLLTHGSLIDPSGNYALAESLEEAGQEEHLIFREDLEKLNYELVILGHWHQSKRIEGQNGYFLYPGSFIPVSRREKGEKFYWILKISEGEGIDLQNFPVNFGSSWYYREESLFSLPGGEQDLTRELRELLEEIEADDRCSLIVVIKGFLPKEAELERRNELLEVTRGFTDKFREVQLDWKNTVTDKIDKPLVSRFIRGVEKMDNSGLKPGDFLDREESQLADFFREALEEGFETVKREILEQTLQVFFDRLD